MPHCHDNHCTGPEQPHSAQPSRTHYSPSHPNHWASAAARCAACLVRFRSSTSSGTLSATFRLAAQASVSSCVRTVDSGAFGHSPSSVCSTAQCSHQGVTVSNTQQCTQRVMWAQYFCRFATCRNETRNCPTRLRRPISWRWSGSLCGRPCDDRAEQHCVQARCASFD